MKMEIKLISYGPIIIYIFFVVIKIDVSEQ